MTVRRASRRDAAILAALLVAFNTEFETWVPPLAVLEPRFAALLERADVIVLLAADDEVTGFALTTLRPSPYYDGPVAALDELYVVPARRGHGIGTELMDALVDELRGRACGEIQINVDGEDHDTRRFYEARGFVNQEPGSDEPMLCYTQEL